MKKLIPNFSKVFKKLEAATISKLEGEATLLAIAVDLYEVYKAFNDAEDWHYRLVPDAEQKIGKKRQRTS